MSISESEKGIESSLSAILDRHEREGGFSGAFLVEAGGREVLSGARGHAHLGFRVLNRPDTRFDTASVTKIYTVAAVFRLIDRGLVGLDDRVRDIVDLGDSPIPREVTLGHCLTHTSGIGDDADEEAAYGCRPQKSQGVCPHDAAAQPVRGVLLQRAVHPGQEDDDGGPSGEPCDPGGRFALKAPAWSRSASKEEGLAYVGPAGPGPRARRGGGRAPRRGSGRPRSGARRGRRT